MKLAIQPILRTYCKLKLPKRTPKAVCLLHTTGDRCRELNPADITPITEAIIKDELKEFTVPFTDGYTCFHVKDCAFCSSAANKPRGDATDIFINKKTGFFLCEKCKVTGNWTTFKTLLKNGKEGTQAQVELIKKACAKYDKEIFNWERVTENTIPLSKLEDDVYNNVFKQFKLMLCAKGTAQKLNIMINNKKNLLYFPLHSSPTELVGYKTFDKYGNTVTFPRIDCSGFLLSPEQKSSVVIVPHVPDFLALVSQNLPFQILCLPYGMTNLPQSALPFLEKYNKIILWLGKGAFDGSGGFAKKLNNSRCYVVRPTGSQISPIVAISRKENVTAILEDAKPTWHQFITTFHSLREEVLSELQNKDMVAGVPWKRFSSLTKILKGHRRGELTVLTGPTGAGKTTFMSEYSLDLAMQGVNTLWGSFEIKNCRLAKMMLQQFAGIPLEENLKRFDALSNKFEQLPIFFMTFHGQQPLSVVMDAVEHGSYTYDIAHVIIDNVQFMIEVSSDAYQIDRFWKQDYLIQAFRSFASKNNCHVTLVMHPKKGMDGMDLSINSIFGGAKAAQEADNIFIIQSKGMGPFGGKKFLQICKNRFSGDLGIIPLNFDKNSLSFSESKMTETRTDTKEKFQEGFGRRHAEELPAFDLPNCPHPEGIDQSALLKTLS